jgi:acetyl-CoA carboxylase carboxyl transferase subunit alpha
MAVEEDDIEKPLRELEKKIEEITGVPGAEDRADEIAKLQRRLGAMREDIYSRLTPWQQALVARHPKRPYTLDYINHLFTDFCELHGDRKYSDDPAIVCGFAFYKGAPAAVIGHQKGRDTREKVRRNFGMPRPEGYRKAMRVMEMAEKFQRPLFTFIDTPGAYPGKGAEERGQAEAIAVNLRVMARLSIPIIVTVTGEGGSGGALGIAVGDRVLMLEHAVYSVISPEGCAAILWSDQGKARDAAPNHPEERRRTRLARRNCWTGSSRTIFRTLGRFLRWIGSRRGIRNSVGWGSSARRSSSEHRLSLLPESLHAWPMLRRRLQPFLAQAFFHVLKPAHELAIGLLQRLLGIDLFRPRHVGEGEKEIPDLLLDCGPLTGRQRFPQL